MAASKQVRLESVLRAQERIKKAGFTHIKFELEGHMARTGMYADERVCAEFIKNKVGAERSSYVVYSMFYRDGSVDSELTMTIPIEKAHEIVHWIKAFRDLAKANGSFFNTANAGLHIALMQGPRYPSPIPLDQAKKANFTYEVTKLMPALIFMGSHKYTTRPLGFRTPRVADDKYSAIATKGNTLEYRVFDTCYDKPEAVWEKIEVIAGTLKFWSARRNAVHFSVPLLINESNNLEKMLMQPATLAVLEKSLKYLVPSYKTVEEAYKERNFRIKATDYQKIEKEFDQKVEKALAIATKNWENRAKLDLRYLRMEIEGIPGWKRFAKDEKASLNFLTTKGFLPEKPSKQEVARRMRPSTLGEGRQFQVQVLNSPTRRPSPSPGGSDLVHPPDTARTMAQGVRWVMIREAMNIVTNRRGEN